MPSSLPAGHRLESNVKVEGVQPTLAHTHETSRLLRGRLWGSVQHATPSTFALHPLQIRVGRALCLPLSSALLCLQPIESIHGSHQSERSEFPRKLECLRRSWLHVSGSQPWNLEQHVKLVHEGRKDFSYTKCEKAFQLQCQLTEQMRIHTGEKLCQCKVCGKQFNRKVSLRRHGPVHETDLRFTCELCEHQVHSANHLRTHRATWRKGEHFRIGERPNRRSRYRGDDDDVSGGAEVC